MKRSRLGPKSYSEAIAKRSALQERKRELAINRRTPMKRTRMKTHRQSPEERQWREDVLARDGYRCRWVDQQTGKRCEVTGAKNLNAHHIRERTQRPDLVLDRANGAALCGGPGRHHDRVHHTVQGRRDAIAQKLLGGETYEAAQKRKQ